MNKSNLILFISIFPLTLLGGCNVNPNEGITDKETISKMKEVIVSYMESHFDGVNSVEVQDPYISPMGGIQSHGTINNDEALGFTITISEGYEVMSVSTDKNFPKMKEDCIEADCDY